MARWKPKRTYKSLSAGCRTVGYSPTLRATHEGRALADAAGGGSVAMLLRGHLNALPTILREGDARTTPLHDSVSHQKILEVTTRCRNGVLHTLLHSPTESISTVKLPSLAEGSASTRASSSLTQHIPTERVHS